jgi:hypothetical protein
MTPEEAKYLLSLPLQQPNDARVKTIREYLQKLLTKVLEEGESFSGKRPFGNSGWHYELYFPLVQANLVKGTIEDGCLEDYDGRKADKLIAEAVKHLFAQ